MAVPAPRRLITDDFGTIRRYKLCAGCRSWLPMDHAAFAPRRLVMKDGAVVIGFDPRCRECDKARCLANQAKWRKDPEKRLRIVESQRMNYRLREARKGRVIEPLTEAQYRKRYGSGATRKYAVGAEVRAAVVALIDAELGRGRELEEIAERAGLPARRLWALRNGEGGSLSTIDRLCIALGIHLTELGA